MKYLTFLKPSSMILVSMLFSLMLLISPVSFAAGAMEYFSPDDIARVLCP